MDDALLLRVLDSVDANQTSVEQMVLLVLAARQGELHSALRDKSVSRADVPEIACTLEPPKPTEGLDALEAGRARRTRVSEATPQLKRRVPGDEYARS